MASDVQYRVEQQDTIGRWMEVGSYSSEMSAEATADQMADMNGLTCQVVRVEREIVYETSRARSEADGGEG